MLFLTPPFSHIQKLDLADQLQRDRSMLDIVSFMRALKKTLDFEKKLNVRFKTTGVQGIAEDEDEGERISHAVVLTCVGWG